MKENEIINIANKDCNCGIMEIKIHGKTVAVSLVNTDYTHASLKVKRQYNKAVKRLDKP